MSDDLFKKGSCESAGIYTTINVFYYLIFLFDGLPNGQKYIYFSVQCYDLLILGVIFLFSRNPCGNSVKWTETLSA